MRCAWPFRGVIGGSYTLTEYSDRMRYSDDVTTCATPICNSTEGDCHMSQLMEAIDHCNLMECIPGIAYIANWDHIHRSIYCSSQIELQLGFTLTEWTTNPTLWFRQIHPDDRNVVLEHLMHIYAGDAPVPIDYRFLTRENDVLWFRDNGAILYTNDGQPLAYYGVMLNISKEKYLSVSLNTCQQQLQDLSQPLLDRRELMVLRHIRMHHTDKEIAATLAISERTVRNYLKNICVKLNVRTRREVIREALRIGLLKK